MSITSKTIYIAQRDQTNTFWEEKHLLGNSKLIATDATGSIIERG